MIIVEFKNIDGKPEVGKWVSNGRNIGPVLKSDGVNVTINQFNSSLSSFLYSILSGR